MGDTKTKRYRLTIDLELPADQSMRDANDLKDRLTVGGATNIEVAIWEVVSYAENKKNKK